MTGEVVAPVAGREVRASVPASRRCRSRRASVTGRMAWQVSGQVAGQVDGRVAGAPYTPVPMGGLPELLTAPWPLTGRHEEVDGIGAAIEDGCPAFFVLGEAGTGKTRLAREVLRRLEREGWTTAGATASESAQATPLGAVAHLVPADAVGAPHTLVQATREAIEARTDGRRSCCTSTTPTTWTPAPPPCW